jgi:DNA-directed RNA polymerase subunit M/transcription elongation factor TFIIS
MSKVSFFCAVCGEALSVDAAFAGEVVECDRCARWVPVPGFPGQSPLSGCASVYPPKILAMEVIFLCPSCNVRMIVDARWEGREVDCPKCEAVARVPWWSRYEATTPARRESLAGRAPALSAEEIGFLSGELSPLHP